MIDYWQKKYPETFSQYKIDSKEATLLAPLLALLEVSKIMSEPLLGKILKKYDHETLYDSSFMLSKEMLLTKNIFLLLLDAEQVEITAKFISDVNASDIYNQILLSNPLIIDNLFNLSRLIQRSSINFCMNNLSTIFCLAEVLSNPLSRAMLTVRLRINGDDNHYLLTDEIIIALKTSSCLDEKIQVFFDYCATFPLILNSQKHLHKMPRAGYIRHLVNDHYETKSNIHFDESKYELAATFINTNLYSTLSFDDLMASIHVEIIKLKTNHVQITVITPDKKDTKRAAAPYFFQQKRVRSDSEYDAEEIEGVLNARVAFGTL